MPLAGRWGGDAEGGLLRGDGERESFEARVVRCKGTAPYGWLFFIMRWSASFYSYVNSRS
jgi:hypothetical protein